MKGFHSPRLNKIQTPFTKTKTASPKKTIFSQKKILTNFFLNVEKWKILLKRRKKQKSILRAFARTRAKNTIYGIDKITYISIPYYLSTYKECLYILHFKRLLVKPYIFSVLPLVSRF